MTLRDSGLKIIPRSLPLLFSCSFFYFPSSRIFVRFCPSRDFTFVLPRFCRRSALSFTFPHYPRFFVFRPFDLILYAVCLFRSPCLQSDGGERESAQTVKNKHQTLQNPLSAPNPFALSQIVCKLKNVTFHGFHS